MRYEMQVWVTVSAESEYRAGKLIKAQLEQRGSGFRKSEVAYIDSEALKAEPECGACGVLLADGVSDYTSCPSCAAHEVAADARYKEKFAAEQHQLTPAQAHTQFVVDYMKTGDRGER